MGRLFSHELFRTRKQAASITEREVDELRERLVRKLQAIRRRDRSGLLAQGWTYDESYDREIPPGWVRPPSES